MQMFRGAVYIKLSPQLFIEKIVCQKKKDKKRIRATRKGNKNIIELYFKNYIKFIFIA